LNLRMLRLTAIASTVSTSFTSYENGTTTYLNIYPNRKKSSSVYSIPVIIT
jgi:hypothetical protein